MLVVAQSRIVNLKDILTYSLGTVSYALVSSEGALAKPNKIELFHTIEKRLTIALFFPCFRKVCFSRWYMALIHGMVKVPATFGELASSIMSTLIDLAHRSTAKSASRFCMLRV